MLNFADRRSYEGAPVLLRLQIDTQRLREVRDHLALDALRKKTGVAITVYGDGTVCIFAPSLAVAQKAQYRLDRLVARLGNGGVRKCQIIE